MQKNIQAFLFLFVMLHDLHATDLIEPHFQADRELLSERRSCLVSGYCRVYQVPLSLCILIRTLLYGNPLQYKNKELSGDLSEQNLCGFDFTGSKFNGANLTNTNLKNAILTNTTCKYLDRFEANMSKNSRLKTPWLSKTISGLLDDIAYFYPNDQHDHETKAKLLHIASGFARLPFYDDIALNIKYQYCSLQLKLLDDLIKLKFKKGRSWKRVFHFQLNQAMEYCSFKSNYSQDKVALRDETKVSFTLYLQEFIGGCNLFQRKLNHDFSQFFHFNKNYYVQNIMRSIEGLGKIYPKIKSAEFRQKARRIGKALSRSYQFKEIAFMNHYLACQNYLISLQEIAARLINREEKDLLEFIYYSRMLTSDIAWEFI